MLSDLDEKLPVTANGKPLEILLVDIEEDPNQPRKEFSEDAMVEMTASIKERGVKQPISVRANPDKKGKWIINWGARRYRGSIRAGKTIIPAFIDEASDSYDQVIENEQRDNLKPMEVALFIKSRMDEGEKPVDIARKLGKGKAAVSKYLSLIDAPDCVNQVYRDGRSTSPDTLDALRKLYDKHPKEVTEWCESGADISRKSIEAFAHKLSKPTVVKDETSQTNTAAGLEVEAGGSNDTGSEDQTNTDNGAGGVATELPYHNPNNEKPKKEVGIPDPTKIKKPLMLVEYKGSAAMVMLNKRPSTHGLIWIKDEATGEEEEVAANKCKINMLTESTA